MIFNFLRSNALEQLEFKLEKIIGIEKSPGKFRKGNFLKNDAAINRNHDHELFEIHTILYNNTSMSGT